MLVDAGKAGSFGEPRFGEGLEQCREAHLPDSRRIIACQEVNEIAKALGEKASGGQARHNFHIVLYCCIAGSCMS